MALTLYDDSMIEEAKNAIQVNMRAELGKVFKLTQKLDDDRIIFILKGLNNVKTYPFKEILDQVKDVVGYDNSSWEPLHLLKNLIDTPQDVKIKMIIMMLIVSILSKGFNDGSFTLPLTMSEKHQSIIINSITGYQDYLCEFMKQHRESVEKLVVTPCDVKYVGPDYTRGFKRPIGFNVNAERMTMETLRECIRINNLKQTYLDYRFQKDLEKEEKRHLVDFVNGEMRKFAYF